jgi:hypothetical protein
MSSRLTPVFYDFEASSLDGVPIEIGWATCDATGTIMSDGWLILPPAEWAIDAVWDPDAEALHGITQAMLKAHGKPPFQVAQLLNTAVAGRDVFADSPFDEAWLNQLFDAAGLEPTFQLRRMLADLYIDANARRLGLDQPAIDTLHSRADEVAPRTHRAEADARHWATLWQLVRRAGLHGQ